MKESGLGEAASKQVTCRLGFWALPPSNHAADLRSWAGHAQEPCPAPPQRPALGAQRWPAVSPICAPAADRPYVGRSVSWLPDAQSWRRAVGCEAAHVTKRLVFVRHELARFKVNSRAFAHGHRSAAEHAA